MEGTPLPSIEVSETRRRVGLQLFLVLLDVIPEADASDLFFPFDQDLYVDRKFAVDFLQGFERFQVDVDLAFVVGGTAAK